MEHDKPAPPVVQGVIERLLALEPSADLNEAQLLPGTRLSDLLNGHKMWGYDGYGALPMVDALPEQPTPHEPARQQDCQDLEPTEPQDRTRSKEPRSKERVRANQAQQRYRERLRRRDRANQGELQELAQKLQDLQFETRQLAARQKLMLELVEKQEFHICVLLNTTECMQLEAKLLPQEMAAVMSTSGLGEFTLEQAKQWTLQQWLSELFPSFLRQMARLLAAAEADPMGPDSARLNAVVFIRRGTEARRSLYIQLHSVLLSWNLKATQEVPREHQPTTRFWARVLAGLRLTEEQQQQVLELRARVITWLNKADELRAESYLAIGHDLTWQPDDVADGKGVRMLRSALELERRASGHFFYEFLFDVLRPVQEVWLDAGPICPPWNANLWSLGEVLATQHGHPPAPALEALQRVPPGVKRFMPALSGFNLLKVDCLAQGGGTQLKRGLLCCWYLTTGRSTPPGDPAIMLHPNPQQLLHLTVEQLQSQNLPELPP